MTSDKHDWEYPPSEIVLCAGEVHVWKAKLGDWTVDAVLLADELSGPERRRSECFVFERDRLRYIVAHGLLRRVLARYEGVAPAALRIANKATGKPYLRQSDGTPASLRFNMSVTDGIMLCAVTRGTEVGVDVERIHPIGVSEVAERVLAPEERSALATCPQSQHAWAFFHCWTRKEAYLKALGAGLLVPLDTFAVTFTPGNPPRLLYPAQRADPNGRWSLYDLAPGDGFAGALVVRNGKWIVRKWRLA